MRAVVTNSNCGATTNFQTKVFIQKVDDSKVTKTLIRLDGHPKDVDYKLSWINDTELLISELECDDLLGFTNQG